MKAGPWLSDRATLICNTHVSSRPRLYREMQAAEQDGALSTVLISALGAFLHHQPRVFFASTGLIFEHPEIH